MINLFRIAPKMFSVTLSLIFLTSMFIPSFDPPESAYAKGNAVSKDTMYEQYNKGHFSQVISYCREVIEENSDDVAHLLLMGRALVDLGKPGVGLPYLKKAMSLHKGYDWMKAWGLAYLGLASFATGDRALSKNAFSACGEMSVSKNAAKFSSDWSTVLGFDLLYNDWKVVETENFIFHFQTPSPVTDYSAFADARQKGFDTVNAVFKAKLPKKIDFFVWSGATGAAAPFKGQLGFAKAEFCVIHSRHNQTIGHELTHIITHHAVTPTLADKLTPVIKVGLINEGVAVLNDLAPLGKLIRARMALKSQGVSTVSLKKLWKDWSTLKPVVSYPLAGAFVGHLIKHGGQAKFMKLLADQSFENAATLYGPDLDKMIISFEKLLRQ